MVTPLVIQKRTTLSKPQFFKCSAKTILSGKVSIEETKAEEKATWEVVV
jgi:hypothetical protein